jgi:hypothetical protein
MDSLWPVIGGGVIGVAGGVIGPTILYRQQSKNDNRRRLAEKFEALVAAVYEHDHWLEALRDHRLFRAEAPPAIPPLRKVQTLATVYFPALVAAVSRFEAVSRTYHMWILDRAQALLANPQADVQQGHQAAYEAYLRERNTLQTDLSDYARRHFNPTENGSAPHQQERQRHRRSKGHPLRNRGSIRSPALHGRAQP